MEEFLADCKIDHQAKIFIISQLCNALDYLHQNLILHRDFNINNILINPENYSIKIIDFGLSRRCFAEEELISPQGNLNYRLPLSYKFLKNPFMADIWNYLIVFLSVVLQKKFTTKKILKRIQSIKKNPSNKKLLMKEKLSKVMSLLVLGECGNSELLFKIVQNLMLKQFLTSDC